MESPVSTAEPDLAAWIGRSETLHDPTPGRVVHGPLIATLLLDLLHRERPAAQVATFRFKALRPTFDGQPMRLNGALQEGGKTLRLWAQDHAGWLTMDASATLR